MGCKRHVPATHFYAEVATGIKRLFCADSKRTAPRNGMQLFATCEQRAFFCPRCEKSASELLIWTMSMIKALLVRCANRRLQLDVIVSKGQCWCIEFRWMLDCNVSIWSAMQSETNGRVDKRCGFRSRTPAVVSWWLHCDANSEKLNVCVNGKWHASKGLRRHVNE